MRDLVATAPEAVICDPDPVLRRDLRIFLVRHCGLAAQELEAAEDYAPEAGAAPRLIVTSDCARAASGLALIRRARASGLGSFILYLDRQVRPDAGGDAFAAGADDVVRLPFTIREFGLRLRARLGPGVLVTSGGAVPVPQIMLDAENRLLAAGTARFAQLTPAEAEVAAVLIQRGGEPATRDDLSRAIDNCEWAYGDRKFDVHVTKIRKKMKQAFGGRYLVRSIRSEGYCLCEVPGGDSAQAD